MGRGLGLTPINVWTADEVGEVGDERQERVYYQPPTFWAFTTCSTRNAFSANYSD
jgi:hypothetical protein